MSDDQVKSITPKFIRWLCGVSVNNWKRVIFIHHLQLPVIRKINTLCCHLFDWEKEKYFSFSLVINIKISSTNIVSDSTQRRNDDENNKISSVFIAHQLKSIKNQQIDCASLDGRETFSAEQTVPKCGRRMTHDWKWPRERIRIQSSVCLNICCNNFFLRFGVSEFRLLIIFNHLPPNFKLDWTRLLKHCPGRL